MPWLEYDCEYCGTHVRAYRSPANLKGYSPRFCSLQCLGLGQQGSNNPAWSGGTRRHSAGYVWIYKPDHPNADVRGCVLEHRLVMEQHLGRLLEPQEVVHHINGVRDDNRIENLELIRSQGEHIRRHMTEKNPSVLPPGQWARHFDSCIECGTTDIPHDAKGLCERCNSRREARERRARRKKLAHT